MSEDVTVSWYGQFGLMRGFCKFCKARSFVIDERYKCCGRYVNEDLKITKIERQASGERRHLSLDLRRRILFSQKHLCYYCGLDLSQAWFYYDKRGNLREVKINFDHFIPASFAVIENFDNLYAACSICNRYKASKVFDSHDDCIKYLRERRIQEGLDRLWKASDLHDYEIGP